jgi:hypothetical protein
MDRRHGRSRAPTRGRTSPRNRWSGSLPAVRTRHRHWPPGIRAVTRALSEEGHTRERFRHRAMPQRGGGEGEPEGSSGPAGFPLRNKGRRPGRERSAAPRSAILRTRCRACSRRTVPLHNRQIWRGIRKHLCRFRTGRGGHPADLPLTRPGQRSGGGRDREQSSRHSTREWSQVGSARAILRLAASTRSGARRPCLMSVWLKGWSNFKAAPRPNSASIASWDSFASIAAAIR